MSELSADGSVGAATTYTLTATNGLLTTDTLPVELPGSGVTPLTVPVEPGRYQVQFGEDVEPFFLRSDGDANGWGKAIVSGLAFLRRSAQRR